ncbi:MAG: glycosyltransferase [Bacteroidetes bacterium]|nr:glycosyltransferase [Bacteroidota bacterium]
MNQTLYILVDDFSNEHKEAFFENELPSLCSRFKKIYVISLYPENNKTLNFTADNLEVLDFNYFAACNRAQVFKKNTAEILRVFLTELKQTHNKLFYIKNFKSLLNQLVLTFAAAANLQAFIKKDINHETVFYCYWFKQWAAALSIISTREPKLKFVSRVHGGDYDEGQIKTVLPFRYFQLAQVTHIFPVSEYGKTYLVSRFNTNPSKITIARLGLALNSKTWLVEPTLLHIVSCSSVIPLKRVHLIAEILKHVKIPCRWTHFGDGPLLKEIKHAGSSLQHTVDLKGHIPNKEFIAYLNIHPISCFINVSESEGIPVSMMEAIACGIPLIGTNVGGVSEIVTPETGFLLDSNFNAFETAELIMRHHKNGTFYNANFRRGITDFYVRTFYAPINHSKLASELVNL